MNEDSEIAEPTLEGKPRPSCARTLVMLALLHATSVGLFWLGMNAVLPDGSNRGVSYERPRVLDAEHAKAITVGLGFLLSFLAGFLVRASGCLIWIALAGGYMTWSVLDASRYGGHTMLPFEWGFAMLGCAPLFLLVISGRALRSNVDPLD